MPEKKTDRRTRKTKKAICEAFAELLAEKELHKVTIQEIADKADVNRGTIYKHYLDVYDLYEKLENEMLVETGLLIMGYEDVSPEQLFIDIVTYVDENRAIFRLLFAVNSTGQMRSKFNKMIKGIFRQIESEKYNIEFNNPELEYRSVYRSHGCVAVIEHWVQGGFVMPKELVIKALLDNTRDF